MPKLYQALLAAQRELRSVAKDQRDHRGRSYTSHESIVELGSEALHAHGLLLVVHEVSCQLLPEQIARRADKGPFPGAAGTLTIRGLLAHAESGETMSVEYRDLPWVPNRDMWDDKARAAAESYALIYVYRNLLQFSRGVDTVRRIDDRRDADHGMAGPPEGGAGHSLPVPPEALARAARYLESLDGTPGAKTRDDLHQHMYPRKEPHELSSEEMVELARQVHLALKGQ